MLRKPKTFVKKWTVYNRIEKALEENRVLKIEYDKIDNTRSERCVHPLVLSTCAKDHSDLLFAFCELREDFRTFRTDRIIDAVLLYRKFDPAEFGCDAEDKIESIVGDGGDVVLSVMDNVYFEDSELDKNAIVECPVCSSDARFAGTFDYYVCENDECDTHDKVYFIPEEDPEAIVGGSQS